MPDRLYGNALATVFGGSGFLGRYTVAALAKNGWRVRAAVRRPDLAGFLQPSGSVGQIFPVQANIRYAESVQHAMMGSRAVVNAVGVLVSSGRQNFRALHVDGARAIAKAAREAGVERLVHISAIGADPKSSSRYARTKGEGEAAVLEEFPDAIILRPSIVFGPEDEFFNRFASMARTSPFLPLIGGGKTRFQPVFVGDLGSAIAASIDGAAKPGTVYEIGGPEVFSFRELLDLVQEWAERPRAYLPIPFWLAKLQAVLTWPLPNSWRPITYDPVRLLQQDNIVSERAKSEKRTIAALGTARPNGVAAIVPTYLERFRPRGQFAAYRS
ncbi:MAG: complex I NDUFA9 subunit family protein [Hyphomicrobium sp.]